MQCGIMTWDFFGQSVCSPCLSLNQDKRVWADDQHLFDGVVFTQDVEDMVQHVQHQAFALVEREMRGKAAFCTAESFNRDKCFTGHICISVASKTVRARAALAAASFMMVLVT